MSQKSLPSLQWAPPPSDACTSCVGRRDFIRLGLGAALMAGAAVTAPAEAAALPVRWVHDTGADGELRYPVPATDGVEVDRKNELLLVRHGTVLAAFALSCPHQHSLLRWREKDGIFQCTKHHSEYSPTGEYERGRATRNMDRLGLRREGDEVVVDPGTVFHSDDDPRGWAAAALAVS